jgi:hypothetical protein
MRYRYEIDEHNAIRVWDDENPNENGAPFLYQPVHPDGSEWDSREEAEDWVEAYIANKIAADALPEITEEPETPADPE